MNGLENGREDVTDKVFTFERILYCIEINRRKVDKNNMTDGIIKSLRKKIPIRYIFNIKYVLFTFFFLLQDNLERSLLEEAKNGDPESQAASSTSQSIGHSRARFAIPPFFPILIFY